MNRLARHFTDLEVYQLAADAAQRAFQVVRRLPRWDRDRLGDQILRASRAVPSLIAEAWGRRHYPRAFREKLSQALGETFEVQAWIDCARRCDYISLDEWEVHNKEWEHVGRKLNRMIQKAAQFSGSRSKVGDS